MEFQFLLFPTSHTCQWCEVCPASIEVAYPESLTVPRNGHLVEKLCQECFNDLFAWEQEYA